VERKSLQYQAATAEGAQWQYATDAARAAAGGWVVESVGWEAASPPMLGATYVYTGAPRPSGWPSHGPTEAAYPTSRDRHSTLAAALIAFAVVVAAWLLTN
jgi:hypothetical protein